MTYPVTRCRACSAPIFFARTAHSERMPVDAKPTADGNLAVTPSADSELPTAVVLRPAQAAGMRAAGQPTYTSHFAGCPKADEFRKRARNAARAAGARDRAVGRSRGRRRS